MRDEITLSTIDYAVKEITEDCLFARSNLKVEEIRDITLRGLVTALFTSILTEEPEIQELPYTFNFTYSFEYPESWWQHLKFQLFPDWLKRHFPVKLKVIKDNKTEKRIIVIKKYATYPKANIAIPKLGRDVFKFHIEEQNARGHH